MLKGEKVRTPTSATGSHTSRQTGFTLFELIVAISLGAMVLGLSIPAFQNFYQSAQYRGAVSDVVSALNGARYKAIREGAFKDILINPKSHELVDGEQRSTLPEALQLEVLGSGELNRDGFGVIRFYPDGRSSGGAVKVSHPNGMEVQVEIDWLLGRVELCKQDCLEF